MQILGIDPGFTRTACVVMSEEGPEFIKRFSLDAKRKNDADQLEARMTNLFDKLDEILKRFPAIEILAVEKVDWHQRIGGANFNYKKERDAQASMAMFKTMLTSYQMTSVLRLGRRLRVIFIGAVEWKREFGAATKDGVQELCHVTWQDKVLWNREESFYYWQPDGHKLEDHETDAMAIGFVVLNQLLKPLLKGMR